MSWQTTSASTERETFILEVQKKDRSISELTRHFGISRKTAYKWLGRFAEDSWAGLVERSRAPQHHPNALSPEWEERILALKARHPLWGAPKLRGRLQELLGAVGCPSESSIGRLLQRHGLVRPRGRRRAQAHGTPLQEYTESNAIWCADFKGYFATRDGIICTPLTISDGFSRYLLRCQGLTEGTGGHIVQPIFEAAMREFGVPTAIRTDNGPPFASVGLGGLSALSVWWLRLGIRLERSRPGCPQDNGRHERMHRTLKEATLQPPQANARAQQRVFDEFRREYNEERPHEAHGQRTPSSVYVPSPRDFPARLPEWPYHETWPTRQVRPCGKMKWKGHDVYVSQALVGERIGFKPVEDGVWMVYFASHPLGLFDERLGSIAPLQNQGSNRGRGRGARRG